MSDKKFHNAEYSHLSRDEIITMLNKSQQLVETLNENARTYRLKISAMEKRISVAEEKVAHFDILLSAIRENEVVKGAWNKFMMTLRMTGYDKSNG